MNLKLKRKLLKPASDKRINLIIWKEEIGELFIWNNQNAFHRILVSSLCADNKLMIQTGRFITKQTKGILESRVIYTWAIHRVNLLNNRLWFYHDKFII